jgi:hypothetical protein
MTVELPEIAVSSGQAMVLPPKPPLQRAKTEPTAHSAYTKAEKDHVQVIKSLCKTYKATLTKLTYVFASLHDECKESNKISNISEALRAGKRDEMMESIAQSLAGGVEEILRSKDVSLRAGVLRDLRARFVVQAPPAKVDGETQTAQPRERKPKASKEQGNGGEEPVAPKPEAAANGSKEAAATQAFSGVPSKLTRAFSFADRQIQWEVKKLAKIQKEREEKEARDKEAAPLAPNKKAPVNMYAHVQSAIKVARKEEEGTKLVESEKRVQEERSARAEAESRLAELAAEHSAVQGKCAFLSEERDAASHELGIAKGRMREAEGKFEVLRKKAEQEAQGHAETLEVRDAFGERGLEEWAPFPGKRIFQVTSTDMFDGRISSEFRQKDEGTDEKGISLLMGRSAALGTSEVQCILFDPKHLSDVQAARWWEQNRRRFEKRAEQARLLAAAQARVNANSKGSAKSRSSKLEEVAAIQQEIEEIETEPKPAVRSQSAARRSDMDKAARRAAAEVEVLNRYLDGQRQEHQQKLPEQKTLPPLPTIAAAVNSTATAA